MNFVIMFPSLLKLALGDIPSNTNALTVPRKTILKLSFSPFQSDVVRRVVSPRLLTSGAPEALEQP